MNQIYKCTHKVQQENKQEVVSYMKSEGNNTLTVKNRIACQVLFVRFYAKEIDHWREKNKAKKYHASYVPI